MNIDYSYELVVSHATLHEFVFAPIAFSFYYKSLALCRRRNRLMTDNIEIYDCTGHNKRDPTAPDTTSVIRLHRTQQA